MTKAQLGAGDYPAIRYSEIHGSNVYFKSNKNFINPQLIKNKKYCEYGDFLITRVSEDIENAGKAVAYLGEKCILGAAILLIKHNQNVRYLSYIWSSKFVRDQIKKIIPRGTLMNFRTSYINQIKIPLPPRHIQDLIVDYLDNWTNLEQELEKELEKELTDRKKQYQHYKELILTSEKDKWEIKNFGEIANDMYAGSEVTRDQLGTGNYPAVKCKDINSGLSIYFTKCISFVDATILPKKKYFEHGDILISIVGHNKQTSGSASAYLGHEKCILGEGVYTCKHNQNPIYLSYALSSKFCRKQIENMCRGGTVFNFCMNQAKKLKIPLPPIEEQEKIVSKLDKFRTITEDLEEGIPKLLAQTRQQYEYYKEEILRPTNNN